MRLGKWRSTSAILMGRPGRLVAGLLVLLAMLAGGAGETRADKLVSNLTTLLVSQDGYTYFAVDVSNDRFGEGGVAGAQKFTTGSEAGGYTITSVDTCLVYVASLSVPRVSIYTVGADDNPGTSLYTLTNPSSLVQAGYGDNFTSCQNGRNTFTAPASANLAKDTSYFVVFENVGTQATESDSYSDYDIGIVTSGAEEGGGASGWSIANKLLYKESPTASWSDMNQFRSRPVRIQINGTAGTGTDTTAPTLSSATVNGTSLVLTYDEDLDEDSEPAASAYSVSVASATGTAPSSVDVSGMTVTLTLGSAVTFGQMVTVSYIVPSSNPVQDEAGNDAEALTNQSVTNNTNTSPMFASATTTRSFAESVGDATVQTAADVGAVVTATDADNGDSLAYSLEGPGAGFFTIVSGTGQIRTRVGRNYNFERVSSFYLLTVKATDTNGGTDTIAVTIYVTDVPEPPLAPAAPAVSATAGVTMSLNVTWAAPSNISRPDITSYDLQYRKGTTGGWTDGPQDLTGMSARITGLDGNATYQVQVRATNDEGDGPWSVAGSGQTTNTPPEFATATTTRTLAETVGDATVQIAGNVGAVVTATDADSGDSLTYSLEGTDAGKFTIVSGTGQIQTSLGQSYDREAKASYALTVKATDTKGGTDTIAVTVSVTNVAEKPLAPVAPTVTSTSGSTTSVDVTWTAPSNIGRPAIASYDLQYRRGLSGSWLDGPQNQTGTSASISGLDGNTTYQVQMRATNVDGDSDWSPAGSGKTANSPPRFASTATSRSLDEMVGDATVQTAADVGTAVTAEDPDNDTISYSLEGTDAAKFTIGSGTGQIRTRVGQSYDYETQTSYAVTVKATDTDGGSDVITVIINLSNVTPEKPLLPAAPSVSATEGVTMSLDVTWTAPSNTGRPDITSYDLQYRKGTTGSWTDGPQDLTGMSARITGLDGNEIYQVQVRATNVDGDGDWSAAGEGETVNTPPLFADDSTERSFAETVSDATVQTATAIGAVVTATDGDDDTLTYSLEGTDAAKFTIDPGTGQIETKLGESYDRETAASYAVTVKADDSKGGTDTIAVTLTVTNVTEFESARVTPGGIRVYVQFVEKLSSTLSPISAFTVTLDGTAVDLLSLGVSNRVVNLETALRIREGQTVTVSYTDPTAGNDANAIQDEAGNDAASFTDQPVTNDSDLEPQEPRAPTSLVAKASGPTGIDLSWTAPADNGGRVITGYKIEISPDGRQTGLNVTWNRLGTTPNTIYTHTVAAGTTHHYRVSAINDVGTGNAAPTSTATTPTHDGAPTQPQNLEVRYGKTEVDLSWEGPAHEGDNPVTGYRIDVSEDNGVSWEMLETVPVANTGTTSGTWSSILGRGTVQVSNAGATNHFQYTHTDLTPGTTYQYRVLAMNGVVSAPSKFDDGATVCSTCPEAPTNLHARMLPDGQVVLEWVAPPTGDGVPEISYYEWWWSAGTEDGEWRIITSRLPRYYLPPQYVPGPEQVVRIKVRAQNNQLVCVDDQNMIVPPLEPGGAQCPLGSSRQNLGGIGEETATIVVTLRQLQQTARSETAVPSAIQAWLPRFVRTVADQVIEAVEGRIRTAPRPGVAVTLAGERVRSVAEPEDEEARKAAAEEAEAKARLRYLSDWLRDEPETRDRRTGWRPVSRRELLTGSSFALTTGADAAGGGMASLWGRGSLTRFDGREGDLSVSGEVTGLMLGADWTREAGSGSGAGAWTAGLLVSHARGEGSYRGADSGAVSSTVTGLYPYGRYALNERMTVWGTAGYGAGSLSLKPEDGAPVETDIDLMMAAAGLRGVVVTAPAEGGPELAVKTDAMVVRTSSEAVTGGAGGNLAAVTADVTRLRLGLEGTWHGMKLGAGTLEPRLEMGVRHDGGDAETGFGLDLGGGLAWSDQQSGLRAEVSGRGLLTHESAGFRQRGISVRLRWDPRPGSDRGPSLTLSQTMGLAAAGGMDALLNRGRLEGLAANDDGNEFERWRSELKLSYGFGSFGDGFTSRPEFGLGLTDTSRELSLGWRLVRDRRHGNIGSLDISFEGRRVESANDNVAPEHSIGVRLTARY